MKYASLQLHDSISSGQFALEQPNTIEQAKYSQF